MSLKHLGQRPPQPLPSEEEACGTGRTASRAADEESERTQGAARELAAQLREASCFLRAVVEDWECDVVVIASTPGRRETVELERSCRGRGP